METAPRVIVYSASYCGYCWRAKRLLDQLGIPYEERDITTDFKERKRIADETGHRTVPNIFIDGKSIGGSDDLAVLAQQGNLDHLKKPAA